MIFSLTFFLHRHFWFVLITLCALLGTPHGSHTPRFFNQATLSRADLALFEKIQGLSQQNIRSLNIMARTVYGETRNQRQHARTAVAHVILNRSKTPHNISKVVFKRKQFTCWSDHNRSAILAATTKDKAFLQSLDACVCAIKSDTDITQGADHYHATYVRPYWSRSQKLKSTGRFGQHIFYKRCQIKTKKR